MWKGFFSFLLFMAAFCGFFIGIGFGIGGIGMAREGVPHGELISLGGAILTVASYGICRSLMRKLSAAFAEDAKNPPPPRYEPGRHKHDPK